MKSSTYMYLLLLGFVAVCQSRPLGIFAAQCSLERLTTFCFFIFIFLFHAAPMHFLAMQLFHPSRLLCSSSSSLLSQTCSLLLLPSSLGVKTFLGQRIICASRGALVHFFSSPFSKIEGRSVGALVRSFGTSALERISRIVLSCVCENSELLLRGAVLLLEEEDDDEEEGACILKTDGAMVAGGKLAGRLAGRQDIASHRSVSHLKRAREKSLSWVGVWIRSWQAVYPRIGMGLLGEIMNSS